MTRHLMGLWLGLALASFVAARAEAQQLDLTKGGPIDITATDGIDWQQNEKKIVARGNAKAVRENVTVTADRLIAYYRRKPGAPEAGAKPHAVSEFVGFTAERDALIRRDCRRGHRNRRQ